MRHKYVVYANSMGLTRFLVPRRYVRQVEAIRTQKDALERTIIKQNFQIELLRQALYEDFQLKSELYSEVLRNVAREMGIPE